MTTIAFKDGVLAADRLLTEGGRRFGTTTKITRSKDAEGVEVLVAASGVSSVAQRFLRWAESGMPDPPPAMKEDDSKAFGVVFYKNGRMVSFDPNEPPCSSEMMRLDGHVFAAIGSGGEYALGAMAAGQNARVAIEVAAVFDVHTGGGVDVLIFGDEQPIPVATGT